ncbi:MAG: hypothetical protein Q4G06_00370 [Clostridia bacterium]|nr:hypothetical protein [Clostridia bacterium]
MFDISVDQYFYPAQNSDCSCRKRIDTMLNSLDEKDLQVVEAIIQALKNVRETEDGEWCHPTSLWSTADHNCILYALLSRALFHTIIIQCSLPEPSFGI